MTVAENHHQESSDEEPVNDGTLEKLDEALNLNVVLQRDLEAVKVRARVMLEQKDHDIEKLKA